MRGDVVMPGYWQQPELDEDKFQTIDRTRWYRSGDIARMTESDGLYFLGRLDHQIKIRGYRVETLEIEGALRAATGRDLVAVLPLSTASGDGVEGVVGFVAGEPLDTATIQERLQGRLPDYMLPQALVFLDALPLNSNGKVDLRALAEMSASDPVRGRVRSRRPDRA